MIVKDLITNFDTKTPYTIKDVDNPHNIIWQGRGNKLTHLCDKNIVCGVGHTSKSIVIYITQQWNAD